MIRFILTKYLVLCFAVLCITSMVTAQTSLPLNSNWIRAIVWSPDGTQIAFGTQGGIIQILDGSTGQRLLTLQNDATSPIYTLNWSPDGLKLASGGFDRLVKIWDTHTGGLIQTFAGHAASVGDLDWHPDGIHLASAAEYENPIVWDTTTGVGSRVSAGDAFTVQWSPDGNILAVGGQYGQIRLYPIGHYNYENARIIEGLPGIAWRMAWDESGTNLAVGITYTPESSMVQVWNVATNQLIYNFEENTSNMYSIKWSPDNNFLVTASVDQTVRIWDMATGLPIEVIQTQDPAFSVDFSPFGGRLAFGAVSSETAGLQQDAIPVIESFADGAIQIVVPAPSLERLQAIQAACMTAPALATMDAQEITVDALPDYVAQIEALTDAEIPPGCAADLVAVAEALIAEGQ